MQKELIRETISQVINLPIKKEEVKIKKGIIYLNIKPIYKNEIFLKQDEIFKKLKEALGKKSPKKFM